MVIIIMVMIVTTIIKNGKSKDYCKADSEQRVLFFLYNNNILAGHTSPLQV